MTEEDVRATGLRHAMGHFATGVAVVTTLEDGHDHAMTANSLTSVSLDPPLVLVWVREYSGWHEAVRSSGVWGVSLLPSSGRPAASALATLECRTRDMLPAGDHTIVVGEVVSSHSDPRRDDPLVYYRSRYTSTR